MASPLKRTRYGFGPSEVESSASIRTGQRGQKPG